MPDVQGLSLIVKIPARARNILGHDRGDRGQNRTIRGVDKDKITRETSFVNDLGADSLDTVELVMELEEEFDITIPDDAAEKIQTVGQAISYIDENSQKS